MEKKVKWKYFMFLSLMFSVLFFSVSAFAAETQTISIDPATSSKAVNDSFSIDVKYSITNEASTGGIGIRVHFNSKKVAFTEFSYIDQDKLSPPVIDSPQNDTPDYDNDASTDKYVAITWADFSNGFSGASRTLATASFTVNSDPYNGVTAVTLSHGSLKPGLSITLGGNLALTITGGKDAPATPVLSPVTGFYKAAVSVTATVDAAPIKSFYTTDGTTPTTGSTEYTGAAISVDGSDGDTVVVKMISNDAAEGISGDVGSEEYTFDKADPIGTITAPTANALVSSKDLTISGTATDGTGSGVEKVEISIDGGSNWNDATVAANWTYEATLAKGANVIHARVTDKLGQTATIVGNTITYYPALALSIDGNDVTGQTINIPNTAGSNTRIITVSGGSESYSTYTWIPLTQANVGTLTPGVSNDKKVYTADVGQTGTHTIIVTDPINAALFQASLTVNVVDFSVTGPAMAYLGTALDFIAAGQTGDVSWTVKTGPDVAGTPATSGANNSKATITPLKAGTFELTATDGGTSVVFDVPQVTIYTVPGFASWPTETLTINPGANAPEFSVSGGDGNYTWAVAGPSPVAGGTTAAYTFTAPTTGNFAGTYTITATESGSYSKSFQVYVPLKIDPTHTNFVFVAGGNPQPFTVTGAANATAYTKTITSLDDAVVYPPDTGAFDAQNSATFPIDPNTTDYPVKTATGTQQYTLDFEATGHQNPPQIMFDVVPVKTYAGYITDSDGGALAKAVVTVTSPAAFEGRTQTSAADGKFSFDLPAPEKGKYLFKVVKDNYLPRSFGSDDDLTAIKMTSSKALISGTVTINSGGVMSSVSLFDANDKVAGPLNSDTAGNFRFEFAMVPDVPATYTIRASRPGFSGFTTITAQSFDYTASFAMTALSGAGQTPPTNPEPAGNIGVMDAAAGGESDMTGDAGLGAGANDSFGSNTIKLIIAPQQGGGIVRAALPIPAVYKASATSPGSAFEWEIEGLGAGCAVIPVPFKLGSTEEDKLRSGEMVVLYAHETKPDEWKQAEQVGEIDFIGDGVNGIIYARICGWSSNILGIGSVPVPVGTTTTGTTGTATSSDSSDCFIGSLSASGTSGNMMAWISIVSILAAGIVLTMNRKRKSN